jgi:hypothetical protein
MKLVLSTTTHLWMILENSESELETSTIMFRCFSEIRLHAVCCALSLHRKRFSMQADALQCSTYVSNVLVGIQEAAAQKDISMLPKGFVLSAGCLSTIFLG